MFWSGATTFKFTHFYLKTTFFTSFTIHKNSKFSFQKENKIECFFYFFWYRFQQMKYLYG